MPEPGSEKRFLKGFVRRSLLGEGLGARLLRGGAASGLIQGINRLLALGLGIFLARFLGAEGYGVYAHVLAMLNLFIVIGGLGMPSLLLREIAAGPIRQEWGLMHGILNRGRQVALLVSSAIAVVGIVVVWWLSAELASAQYHTLILMFLLLPLATVNKNQLAVLKGLDRVTVGLAIEMLLQPTVALVSVAALFLLSLQWRSPEYGLLGQVIAVLASILCVYLVLNRAQPRKMKEAAAEYRTAHWLKSTIPFTLIGSAGIINSQTDILMLGWLRDAEEVGVYRVAVQGAALVAFGLVALDTVVAPHFARLHAKGDRQRLQRLVTLSARAILLSSLPFVLLFVFGGGEIAAWVFGAEFESSHFPLAVLAVAQLVNASMGSVGFLLNMTGHEKDSARVLIATALLNVLLNGILVPAYGFEGAALATGICIVVWKITLAVLVKKRLGLNSTAFANLEARQS